MITEDYVSFEIAKRLKEKEFKGLCTAYYDCFTTKNFHDGGEPTDYNSIDPKIRDIISAPTFQMAMKWLREVHYLHITVHPGVSEYGFVWTYSIVFAKEAGKGETHFYKISQITTPIVKSKSYEEACEAAIKYCLEHLI